MTRRKASPRSRDSAQKPRNSMMPSVPKCYIVLRATTFLRKDSL
jgi:hypothetical protein